jgi:hypothetical protein
MLVIWKLRDKAQPVDLKRLFAVDALAVEQHLAAGGFKAPADQVEQRGLARAVGADDGDALAGLHLQVGAADDFGLAEALAQVFQFKRTGIALMQFPPLDFFFNVILDLAPLREELTAREFKQALGR